MRSQDVPAMLRKPKSTSQTPLTAAAWETYQRNHFHACMESCQTPTHEAATRSKGSCPGSTHNMEMPPLIGPVGISLAGPYMDAALQTS